MNNQEIQTLINDIEETVELLEADLAYCDNKSQSEVLKSEMDLFSRAVKCIKYLQESQQHQQSAWISVKDKLPEKDGEYIVAIKDGRKISISSKPYKKEKGFLRYMASMKEVITHWQPLPEPPKRK